MTHAHRTASSDPRVMDVFVKSIEMAGGMDRFVEHRQLDWLGELMESAYVVVMQDEDSKSPAEIAEYLGVTTGQVADILSSPTEGATNRMFDDFSEEPVDRVAVAGAVARLAHQAVKRERGQSRF